MPALHALLVGIDAYPPASGVNPLAGCINDATAMRAFLEDRFTPAPLNALSLHNDQATRANIIQAFRTHLAQARPGDLALYFYAGHGSEQTATAATLELSSDGNNQTQVLYDSRLPNGQDLLDIELKILLDELTSRGVHTTVILDCCHSGSGTRDLAVTATRQAPTRTSPNLPLLNPQPIPQLQANASLQPGCHIALEACECTEVANEYLAAGQHRGAFTFFLLQELASSPDLPSYLDLMNRVKPRVQAQVSQSPQLEEVHGNDHTHNVFLSLTPAAQAHTAMARYSITRTWQITSGAIASITPGDTYALYPLNQVSGIPLATATVATAAPGAANLTIPDDSKLDQTLFYTAIPISRATRIPVLLDGDPTGQSLLRTALASSLAVREAETPAAARLAVTTTDGQFHIYAPLLHGKPHDPIEATPENAQRAALALDHMATWITRVELSSPNTLLPPTTVQFTILQPNQPDLDITTPFQNLQLKYTPDSAGTPQPPTLKVRITNTSIQTLYVALLAFDSAWSITAGLLAAGTQTLDPTHFIYASGLEGQPDGPALAMEIDPSATQSDDDLLLIASTDPFNARTLEQPSLAELLQGTRAIVPQPTRFRQQFLTRRLHLHTTR
jgi:hypothetical protein